MEEPKTRRTFFIKTFILLATLILLGRAAHLQIFDKSFRKQANAVAMEKYTDYPARGLVYDRNGTLLISNQPMYDLLVTYNQIDKGMDTLKFCNLLGIKREYFETTLQKDWADPRYDPGVPFTFLSKIAADKFLRFQESLYEFPGFEVQPRTGRDYPLPIAAHVLGYIQEVTKSQIETRPEIYSLGDYIGASGIEWSYEEDLRGTKGYRYVLKDNMGHEVGAYADGSLNLPPVSGLDINISLDAELQKYAEGLMVNKVGSVVAIEPATGEILAMVTTPSYDPRVLTLHNNERGVAYHKLRTDPNSPLFNRSIMAEYPPGSLFKPIVALIAMQEGVLEPNKRLTCRGAYYFNGEPLLGCHGHPTCFSVDQAIQYSCNNYFVTVFRDVVDQFGFKDPGRGLDTFNSYLHRFGMGQQLGVDFTGEKKGNVPDSRFYDNVFKNEAQWYSIWIRSLGIGQGELLTTNLQLANMAAILANRGFYYPPHLIKDYRYNAKPKDLKYTTRVEVGIEPQHFDPVVKGMNNVVNAGTARLAYINDIPVCGKTGTAENPHGASHSIFFCFAPMDDPKIAVAVYVENAGAGGSTAAPVASLVIEKYLRGEIESPNRQWLEQYIKDKDLISKP